MADGGNEENLHHRLSLALASMSATLRSLGGPGAWGSKLTGKSPPVKEAATGTDHPCEVCDLKEGRCAQLLGVGPRSKRILGLQLNVYSVGMYANTSEAVGKLKPLVGKGAKLSSSPAVITALSDPKLEKEIRMVVTNRAVSNKQIWKALNERLSPVKEINVCRDPAQGSVLTRFAGHFESEPVHNGTEIRLALSRDNSVCTFIDGKKTGCVVSAALSAALANIYVGEKPPSPVMKQDMLESLASCMAAKPPDRPQP